MKNIEVGDKVKARVWHHKNQPNRVVECITTKVLDISRTLVLVQWDYGNYDATHSSKCWWVEKNKDKACKQQAIGYVVEHYGKMV